MDVISMLRAAALLFALAAMGGLVMAGIRLGAGRNPPVWLAFAHGLLAAAGLTLMLYPALAVGVPARAGWAIALLVLAAAGGGLMNLGYHWRQLPVPKTLLFGHLLLAVAGFALLLGVVL